MTVANIQTMRGKPAPARAQIQRIRRAERRMLIVLASDGKLPGVNAVRSVQAEYRMCEKLIVRSAFAERAGALERRTARDTDD
jgi:hypothetical protein